jgi:hypothetical protein
MHGSFKLIQRQNNLDSFIKGAQSFDFNPSLDSTLESINTSFANLTGLEDTLFKKKDDQEITFDRLKFAELLNQDKINSVTLKSYRNQLNDKLKSINKELRGLRKNEGFNNLERLQAFTWDNMIRLCSHQDTVDMFEPNGPGCSYTNGYTHGVKNLFDFNAALLDREETNAKIAEIQKIISFCDNPDNMASERQLLDRTCSLAVARRQNLERRGHQIDRRNKRRREMATPSELRPVFDRNNNVIRYKKRSNYVREGLTAGFGMGMQTLLPVGIGYFHLKSGLLAASHTAKMAKTSAAWIRAQATFPHNNCHIYVCTFNSSTIFNNLAVSRNSTPIQQGYHSFGGSGGTFNIPSARTNP